MSNGNGTAGHEDARASAEAAGLRYVSDSEPGISRRRCGKGWSYRDPDGETIREDEVRDRIEELAIPPAWEEVWICPDPEGHLQATGRDDEGRKQYRYHPRWQEARAETKFDRMLAFGRALPTIRGRVASDLGRDGLPREKVVAALVRLLESTCLRVGNDEYERENGTHGLTTVRDEHVELDGDEIRFRFPGKGGDLVTASVTDEAAAEVLRRCRELSGEELFACRDGEDGTRRLTSDDVNAYLKEITEEEFTAKNFRTWMGTLHAFVHLVNVEPGEDDGLDAHCRDAVDAAADRLENTRSVCREFYVHPGVLDAFREDDLPAGFGGGDSGGDASLSRDERALLALLERITAG